MFNSILVAVDINDNAGAARTAAAALTLAKANGSSLHLLNVVPDTGMAMVGDMLGPDHMGKMMEQAKADLKAWASITFPSDVDVTSHVTQGSIYDQIIKNANALNVDAIVVGAHSPELKDYLIGPNAARVARHAPQSVIVIR